MGMFSVAMFAQTQDKTKAAEPKKETTKTEVAKPATKEEAKPATKAATKPATKEAAKPAEKKADAPKK